MKIGIPQSMLYYDFNKLFEEFFKNLDIELLVSPKTNINILNQGVINCVDEACLPIKIHHGHVMYLKDKVDYVFVPRIISSYKKEYYCPKQLGMADMVRHNISDITNLLDPIMYFDNNRNKRTSLHNLGKLLNKDSKDIRRACIKALKTAKESDFKYNLPKDNGKINLLIIGHPYNIEDSFINMNIIKKLKGKVNLIFTKDIRTYDIRQSASGLKKRIFWTHGTEIIGSSYYLIDNNLIDGLIYLSAFGCGLDSVLINLVENKANKNEIPLMIFHLDEQTGEAGFNTRLEAFLDMLSWRWKNENKLSPSR